MSRKSLFLLVVTALLTVVEGVAWSRFQSGGWNATGVLALHLGAAAAAALICSTLFSGFRLSTRVTLVIFLVILTSVLPLAGIPIAGLITILLNTHAGDGKGPEDFLTVGNGPARLARRETREASPSLQPFCEAMRWYDEKDTERMLHGLRHMSSSRHTLHFLRRFQVDPRSSLQFASQAIISSEFELRELQVKELGERATENSQSPEPRIQLAEVLLSMADWTPEGDSTSNVYRRDALKHLEAANLRDPANSRTQLLMAKCHLGLGAPAQVAPLVDAVEMRQGHSLQSLELRLKAQQDLGNYQAVREIAAKASANPQVHLSAELSEAVAFWVGHKSASLA
jgi:hypothetical protein